MNYNTKRLTPDTQNRLYGLDNLRALAIHCLLYYASNVMPVKSAFPYFKKA